MKITVVIVLVLFATFLFGYRMHSRVITYGDFYGLRIGSSKEEIVQLLRKKPITSVSIYDAKELEIDQSDKNKIDQLVDFGGIRIRGASSLDEIFINDGVVDRVKNVYGESMVGEILPGQSFAESRDLLRDLVQTSDQVTVSGFVTGYGIDLSRYSADLKNVESISEHEGIDWLMRQDSWAFNTKEGYKRFILTFRDGSLQEIDYKNYFIELP